MKEDLHPEYQLTTITCTCGAVYETRSTVSTLKVGICMACHPFLQVKPSLSIQQDVLICQEVWWNRRACFQTEEANEVPAEVEA